MKFESFFNYIFSIIPLIPSFLIFFKLNDWLIKESIFKSFLVSLTGFFLTSNLIPIIAEYTKKCGMSGKDLGKKGTENENNDVPEALGLCSGTIFLMCTICLQLLFAHTCEQVIYLFFLFFYFFLFFSFLTFFYIVNNL